MKKRIQNLLNPIALEALVIAGAFLLSLFTFSFIIHEAVYEREDVFDNNVIHFFSAHSSPGLIETMKRVTFFGSTTFLLPAYIVLIAWLVFKKRLQYATDIALIAISSTALMYVLKQIFHRHRPQLPIIKGISGYSFPSGHALSSFVFCSILIWLVWNAGLSTARKYLLSSFFLLLALTIGLSRIVLNVHYATDVIGGFCLGMAWVILSFVLIKKIRKNNPPGTGASVS